MKSKDQQINYNEIMERLKQQSQNRSLFRDKTNYDDAEFYQNPLDKVIKINNPLEPEKGGFYQAFSARRDFDPQRKLFSYHNGTLTRFYDLGLKDDVKKVNLENGTFAELLDHNISTYKSKEGTTFDTCRDFRCLSFKTLKNLGLELINEAGMLSQIETNISQMLYQGERTERYKNTVRLGLVSLDELKDRQFVAALDAAAKANNPELPKFDDAKYEQQFNKLNLYVKHFGLTFCHGNNETLSIGTLGQTESETRKRFGDVPATIDNHFKSWRNHFDNLSTFNHPNNSIKLPLPNNCRSEEHYLKLGAHAIVNHLFDSKIVKLNKNEHKLLENSTTLSLVKDISSSMFAAQFEVPVTQNDINRFNCYDFEDKELKKIFNISAKAASQLISMDLSPDKAIQQSNDSALTRWQSETKDGLWAFWKADLERVAIQRVTPSLERLCKGLNVEPSKKSVMTAIDCFVKDKQSSLAANKEKIKPALKFEEHLNKTSLDVAQEKVAKKPVKGTREAAKSMER